MDNVIEIKKVNKIYGERIQTQVLHDIDLTFKKGSFSAIIGASGSGKSTLMNIMGTLDTPTNGEISINGKNTTKMKKNELAFFRNQTIGFVFQFHYLLPEFTAMENILMPYWIKYGRKKPPKEIIEKVENLIDLVGLSSVKNNLSINMSGGQQQRTAIVRALVNSPEIILADEPTGNLDSESTEAVYKILRDINVTMGTSFVIITHDRKIAELTDRIVEIKDGRISMDIVR
ncbi:MAG: ABC transporter ATP-binding protein [Eubacteriales bacterium]